MTPSSDQYAVVRQESDAEAQRDQDSDDEPIIVPVKPSCNKSILLISLVCFCGGVLVGGGIVGCILSSSSFPPSQQCSPSQDEDSVSYNFLKTPCGMSLLSSLKETLEKEGAKSALVKVVDLVDSDDQVASSCHPLTHMLGRASLDKFGFENAFGGLVGTDDASLLRICNAAFMHGIIEHYLGHSTNLRDDVQMVDGKICSKLTNVPQGTWECHHGIGHGVLQNFRLQHSKQALQGALQACHNTSFSRDCENGLWMDHFASTHVGGELDPSSLHVCSELATATWDCTVYSPTEFLLHNPRAYGSAIEFCKQGFGDGNLATWCIEGVGAQAGKENHHNYVPVEQACKTAPTPKEQEACFRQALQYYKMTTGESTVPSSLCKPLTTFHDLCRQMSN